MRLTDKNYTFEALSFFSTRLVDNPSDMIARSELNQIYMDQGLEKKRRELLEETVTFENVPAMALYDYAVLLDDEGRPDDAITYLENAAKKDQNHLIVHTLARLKRDKGQYRDAITYYKLALRDGKESLSILNSIANCYHFLGEYEKSLKVLMLSLLIDSRQIQTWNNLGFALNKLEAYKMSLVCAITIKNLQQNSNTDEKIIKEAVDVLLYEIEVLYGKDSVKAIKETKRYKNYSDL